MLPVLSYCSNMSWVISLLSLRPWLCCAAMTHAYSSLQLCDLLQRLGAQERLWKRAAAKALAEAAAAAVQRGDLRASAKGGEWRGGPAASRVSQPVLLKRGSVFDLRKDVLHSTVSCPQQKCVAWMQEPQLLWGVAAVT